MEYTGIKEEELTAIKEVAVKLAEKSGITIQEACNSIINAMQFLSESISEVIERLTEIFVETCESCIKANRRTRHGNNSRTEKPRKARMIIKWWEKYRPP